MTATRGRVSADRRVCVGSGLCAHVAPTYFDVSGGVVDVLQDQVSGEDADDVAEAVDACPTQALRLIPVTAAG